MFNEEVAMMIYNNADVIKRAESFDNFKGHILRGLDLLKGQEIKRYMFISDNDRRDLDLALKYNIELMSTILMQ